jgi:hypothetical protein
MITPNLHVTDVAAVKHTSLRHHRTERAEWGDSFVTLIALKSFSSEAIYRSRSACTLAEDGLKTSQLDRIEASTDDHQESRFELTADTRNANVNP